MEEIQKQSEKYIKKVIKMLTDFNLLTKADEASLQMLKDTYELYLLCKRDVATNGLVITGANQRLISNPSVNMQLKCVNTMLSILKDFGISSRSRKVLMANTNDDDNSSPLAQFLERSKED